MSEKLFNQSEVEHIVANEVARQRLSDLEKMITVNDSKTAESLVKIGMQIDSVFTLIKEQNIANTKSLKDLRLEIEKDFASKADLDRLDSKVDQLWLKVSIPIATVISIGMCVQYAFWLAEKAK